MKELNIRVSDELGEAFCEFCEEHDIQPDDALQTLVNLYGRAQIDMQEMKEGKLTKTVLETVQIVMMTTNAQKIAMIIMDKNVLIKLSFPFH